MGINKALAFANKIITGNTGYDWDWPRWTHSPPRDGKTFHPGKAADCSSLVGSALKAGWPELDLTGLWYTGNMKPKLEKIGFTAIPIHGITLADLKKQIRPGDVMLNVGYHTEIVGHDLRFGSAGANEFGTATGGQPGNQTGRETRWTPAFIYGKGWDYIMRPPGTAATKPKTETESKQDEGDAVAAARLRRIHRNRRNK